MKAKLIYTGIRVKDMDKSIEFYTKILGMKVTGRTKIDSTKGETVGLVSEQGGHLLELNYYGKGSNFDTKYGVGEGLDAVVDDEFVRQAAGLGALSAIGAAAAPGF